MSDFNFLEVNGEFVQFCSDHDFKFTSKPENGNYSFVVLTGKNGVGKSRFLQLIREFIVTKKNENYPYMIVRRLDYGENADEYDPDKTDHPLVTENVIQSLACDFNEWDNLINNESENKTEFGKIFKNFYSENEKSNIKNSNGHVRKIFFDEFKKYFRRQILKRICYGSLKQMLMLNMRYEFELEEINKFIDDNDLNNGLIFPYEIKKINRGFVDKSDLNDRIIFIHKNSEKKVRFKDLSPGEKLILHLIVLIKDKENIKMENIDKQIKQVLLLDEPDSHCEANLVGQLIEIIQNHLIKMNIQVIMTTHNYLTISRIDNNSLYVMSNNNDQLLIELDKTKSKTFEVLAKNMTDIFKLTDQPLGVRATAYQGVLKTCKNGSVAGILMEDIVKFLTKTKSESLIKILLNKSDLTNCKIKYIDDKWSNLHDCDFSDEFFEENEIYFIIWPTSQNNKAWDFMIFEKNDEKLHLFQVKKSKEPLDETIRKHCEIIIEKLDKGIIDKFCKFKNQTFNLISSSNDQLDLAKISNLLNTRIGEKKKQQKKYKKFGNKNIKDILNELVGKIHNQSIKNYSNERIEDILNELVDNIHNQSIIDKINDIIGNIQKPQDSMFKKINLNQFNIFTELTDLIKILLKK